MTDGVSSVNVWRWTVVEHYSLPRWYEFVSTAFPLVKGFAVGSRLFQVPSATDLLEWGERRLAQE